MVIQWHTIVRHSHILSENTPSMTRNCIPLYKPVINGNITIWERRQSSTLITSLCSSYRHMGSCNSSISTSSIRQGAKIVSLNASFDLPWLHSPLCSIPMDMRHMSGPNFISNIWTSPPTIISWVHARIPLIFTFMTDCYTIWSISVFLQASMKILFRKSTTIGWKDILVWRKLWPL
jgi:hypothetical protein